MVTVFTCTTLHSSRPLTLLASPILEHSQYSVFCSKKMTFYCMDYKPMYNCHAIVKVAMESILSLSLWPSDKTGEAVQAIIGHVPKILFMLKTLRLFNHLEGLQAKVVNTDT